MMSSSSPLPARKKLNFVKQALDLDQMEKAHMKRLAIESSWLNYTRNAIIGSVSGLSLYQCLDIESREDLWPSMLMLGAGFTFMAGGTVQYAVSLMAFEASQSMQMWGLANASLAFSCYCGGLFYFLRHAEGKILKMEAAREAAKASDAEDAEAAKAAIVAISP
ncbi:Hypothetical Protein FCC1311_102672 [Hondaea fermentalgiana]|uniref:Uncharacterized protein n=1 Tax=Hondaea fermentalgiana TaxID=2315210 RepID=A0A2R5H144_9STRA|nr:Hypothetical Protein FCC1311_102672 [Hondaea fermentalgiana]|eukprot:GBG34044.1 Hypothetical Protein FCC1311_102672 [Hondaea fermentalgiana]